MRAWFVLIGLILCLTAGAHAQQRKPDKPAAPRDDDRYLDVRVPEALRSKLVAAAVWVSAGKSAGQMGVLVHRTPSSGLIVTHSSAVPRAAGPKPQIECVFNAGQKNQRKFPATIVETEGVLLMLRVDARDLPTPIRCDDDLEWKAGQPLYAVLFHGPYVVNKGFEGKVEFASVDPGDAVERLDRESVAQSNGVRVKTSWRVGNYGAYVVDAKGALVGFFDNTRNGAGGFMFSHAFQMVSALSSRIRAASLSESDKTPKGVTLDVHASLGNWTNEITAVSLLIAPGEGIPAADSDRGPVKPLANATTHKLEVDERHAVGKFALVNETGGPSGNYLIQFKVTRKGNKAEYTEPRDLTIAFQTVDAHISVETTVGGSSGANQIDAATLPEPRAEPLRLPAALSDVRVGGAGRWIVVRMTGVPGVGVLDLKSPENVNLLRLGESEFEYAAGGDRMVVFLPKSKSFEVWDLEKRELVTRAVCELDGFPFELAMGSASAARFAAFRSQTTNESGVIIDMFDTETLKPLTTPKPRKSQPVGSTPFARGFLDIATNSGLSKIAYWWKSQRTVIPARWNTDCYEASGSHGSGLCFSLADDGTIYSDGGAVLDDTDTEVGQLVAVTPFPGVCSSLVLGVGADGEMKLFMPGRLTPIADAGRLEGWQPPAAGASRAAAPLIVKRVVFAPRLKRLAYFPFENDRVVVQKLDVDEAMKSAPNVVLVTSQPPAAQCGTEWAYRVQTTAANTVLKYELQMGPDGMRVADDGTITWTIPDKPASPTERVILHIQGPDGTEAFHSFVLRLWVPRGASRGVSGLPPARSSKTHEFRY